MDDFEVLAAKLGALPCDPRARMSYDMFAGGLFWSDERPELELVTRADGVPEVAGLGWFRCLLYHRTKLILSEPTDRFREIWEKALRLCPNWPGFRRERRDPGLATTLRAKREAAIKSWEDADARFRQAQAKRAAEANAHTVPVTSDESNLTR